MHRQRWSIKEPGAVLLLLSLALICGLRVSGGLATIPGGPDSIGYLASKDIGLRDGLAGYRTLGYPLFLKLVSAFSPDLAALSYFQLGLHILAVFCFLAGLQGIGISGLLATLICATLLFSNMALVFTRLILSDGPGSSLAIMAVGLILVVVGRRQIWAWAALAATLFATYQMRPAYLFLVPVLPILGLLVAVSVMPRAEFRRQRQRLALSFTATASLPLLLFCCFRWAAVGQFGLVSAAGTNLIGIAGQFLDDDVADRLPADLAVFANAALVRRKEIPELRVASAGEMSNRDLIDARFVPTHLLFTSVVEENMTKTAARGSSATPYTQVDATLMRLSRGIIATRPRLYLVQVLKEFRAGFKVAIATHDITLVVLLAASVLQLVGLARPRRSPFYRNSSGPALAELQRAARVMSVIAMVFCLAKLTLVVLVEPPIERYMWAAGVFMPSLVALAGAALWRYPDRLVVDEPDMGQGGLQVSQASAEGVEG